MKKTIFTIVICLVVTLAFSQERVNREKANFNKRSELMSNATGWAYNETSGEWIDYKNVISPNKEFKTTYKSLLGSAYMKSKFENFITIQARTIIYEETEYICLAINKWSGRYKYPSIQEDWYEFKMYTYIFMTKDEYNKLFNLTNDVAEIQGWVQEKYDYNSDVSEEDFVISKIKEQKSGTKTWFYSPKTQIQVYKATDGSIRFLFGTPSKYTTGIDKKYFETTEAEWNKLKLDL